MANNGIIYKMVKKLNNIFYMQNHCVSNHAAKCSYWDITQVTSVELRVQMKYAVLILNRPIKINQDFLNSFWNNATIRLTVDGGTVKWDKYISNLPQDIQEAMKLPTLVTGDFDSITNEILDKYKKKGCKIVHTPDQMHTDFTKALMALNSYCQEKEIELDYVLSVGQCSGRIDQILGNIQTLFLNKDHCLLHPNTKLFIMSDDALSWLLCPGDHVIAIPEDTRTHKQAWCSLVPIADTCKTVTSTGLKWNLNNQPLKFGDLVSTSNAFSGSDKVTVTCSHTLLWSMRIPSLMSPV